LEEEESNDAANPRVSKIGRLTQRMTKMNMGWVQTAKFEK
jgi:hypothetical protein